MQSNQAEKTFQPNSI